MQPLNSISNNQINFGMNCDIATNLEKYINSNTQIPPSKRPGLIEAVRDCAKDLTTLTGGSQGWGVVVLDTHANGKFGPKLISGQIKEIIGKHSKVIWGEGVYSSIESMISGANRLPLAERIKDKQEEYGRIWKEHKEDNSN